MFSDPSDILIADCRLPFAHRCCCINVSHPAFQLWQLRFQHRFQSAAVRTWQSFVRMQRLGRRVLATFRHSHIRKAWQQWLYQTLRARSATTDDNLTAAAAKAVLNRWRHRHLACYWTSWQDKHRERMLYKTRLRSIICHFGHFHLSTAFRGWLSGMAWKQRSRGLLARAVRRMNGLVAARAWYRWVDVWRTVRRGRRALAVMLRSAVFRAFLCWRESAAVQRQLDGELARLKNARRILEQQQAAAVRLVRHARLRDLCRKALHAWQVTVLSVETKLSHALAPLQHALEVAQERAVEEAEAKRLESEQRLQEVGLKQTHN